VERGKADGKEGAIQNECNNNINNIVDDEGIIN